MKVELLAPSGNFDCVRAAVQNGADAVYLGGRQFNARAYANNFDEKELNEVCDYCHKYGVKVYVTVNTLYKHEEFEELLPFIDSLYAMGVDGLIMQDLGAISLVRKHWPDFHVHISTQLTTNSLNDVKEFEELGATTVVLSRELSLEDIAHITKNTPLRIETFIHGALCVSYSGQCYMSSVLGSRSGNRGKCAQNCRMNYEFYRGKEKITEGHLLSTKDICTLEYLPELLDTGVASLKIEGRMKSPEYVAGVSRIYRKYIDLYYTDREHYNVDLEDIKTLQKLFNRGYFSTGYLKTHSGSDMMCTIHPRNWGVEVGEVVKYDYRNKIVSIRFFEDLNNGDGIEIWTSNEEGIGCYINKESRKDQITTFKLDGPIHKGQKVFLTYDKKLSEFLTKTLEPKRKNGICGSVVLKENEPMQLTLKCNGVSVSVTGDCPQAALNQPLSELSVKEQLSKTGDTVFRMDEIKVEMEGNLFVNKAALNALRKKGCEALEEKMISSYKREKKYPVLEPIAKKDAGKKTYHVEVKNMAQFTAVLDYPEVDVVYFEMNEILRNHLDEVIASAHESGKKLVVKLPRIYRQYVMEKTQKELDAYRKAGCDGFLISSLGHYRDVKNDEVYVDYTANIINSYSLSFWQKKGVQSVAVSMENSYEELSKLADVSNAEIPIYGKLPLMVTHQCPIGNYVGDKTNHMYCREKGNTKNYYLKGALGDFPIVTDCDNCIATIYHKEPMAVLDTERLKASALRLTFLDESAREVKEVLDCYLRGKGEISGIRNLYERGIQ